MPDPSLCEDCDGWELWGLLPMPGLGHRNVALWAQSCRSHCVVSQFPPRAAAVISRKCLLVPPLTTVRTASWDT